MNKFKVGDRVRVPRLDNATGKIIEIYTFVDPIFKNIVKFDAPYLCTAGYGDDALELIEKEKTMEENDWIETQKQSHKREDKLMQIFEYFEAKKQGNQGIKLIEEAAELSTEIHLDNYLGIIEEVADVEVLLDQIKVKYEICPEEVESIKKEKIDRTLKRIRDGYYDKHR